MAKTNLPPFHVEIINSKQERGCEMILGTSHFVSKLAAYRYYRDYGTDKQEVDRKIKDKEIHIGRPVGKNVWVGDDGRYYKEIK